MLEDLLSWDKLLLIAVVLIIFFGPKRIPDIAQSIGKGIREFKKSIKDVQDEVSKSMDSEPAPKPKEIQQPTLSQEVKTDAGSKTAAKS
jgi:TatA/E family protein of Tat protein translocase